MKEKIKKVKQKLAILKRVAIVFTVLAITHLSYTFYEKYNQLKSEFWESISDVLYDEYFPDRDMYYADDDFYKILASSEHENDNVEKLVDYEITNGDYRGYIEELKEHYKGNNKIIDSIIKERRENIRNEIIEKRIKYSAKIESEKEQHKLDSLWEIQSQKFELARDEIVAKENIFSHFSVAYILGVIIGESVIPIIFWLFWFIIKMKLRDLFDLDKNRKIELIKNHPKYAHDYISKYESLTELEKSKILNQFQFTEKHNNLIQEYYLPIIEEQRIDEKNELELKLKTALELGNITQDEFDSKIGYSRASKYKKNL
jgi:hypothetical protein